MRARRAARVQKRQAKKAARKIRKAKVPAAAPKVDVKPRRMRRRAKRQAAQAPAPPDQTTKMSLTGGATPISLPLPEKAATPSTEPVEPADRDRDMMMFALIFAAAVIAVSKVNSKLMKEGNPERIEPQHSEGEVVYQWVRLVVTRRVTQAEKKQFKLP